MCHGGNVGVVFWPEFSGQDLLHPKGVDRP